jgi:DoxX-like family
MNSTQAESSSKKVIWAGRILTLLSSLFMLFDGVMKIVKPVQVLEATARLGYPVSTLTGIGVALIACTLIYVIPRTSIFGAILLTGYLGGAVASNVRAGSGWFETIFPALIAALVWGGIWLRDRRLRNLLWTNRPLSSLATNVLKPYQEMDQRKSILI